MIGLIRKKVVLLFAVVAVMTMGFSTYAAETRGVRVMAKEIASGEQKELKLYNKSYAVIIGIDQYPNLPFDAQLNYPVRDAKGVEQVIRKNFKFDKIITLYNKDATKDSILKVLMGDLAAEMTEEDSLFIFWAGHGNQEKTREGDLGYLIPYDGSATEIYKDITMTQIKDISLKIPAKHIFYVMDACYSGLLAQTRALDKQTKRDYSYLQEMTKERVRQVLTAGGKDEQVLDGGPKGHSVFTGRLIEALENAEGFITANELQASVKERVFSDARAMSQKQTPGFGSLYGVGDYVFVPSIEQKAEDTQEKVAALQREMEQLNATEIAAAKAQDERAKRQVEIEKKSVEARLKAEQLKQQTLEEEKRKRESAEQERRREATELVQKKKADDERLAALKRDVEEKRKGMGGTTLSSLSPDATMTDMQQIENRIFEIREQFRKELVTGINQIVDRYNQKFLKLAEAKQDEFESQQEFQTRIAREQSTLNREQAGEFTTYQDRLETEYKQQITPLVANLKESTTNEFVLLADNLSLELGIYDAVKDLYPITIKAKKPINGIMISASSSVPMPRDEAREFKQHFQNNMLRAEIKGKFETPEVFMIAEAYVMDDATSKKYDLFSARFVDLGNGTLYDTSTKLMWSKKVENINGSWNKADAYIKSLNRDAYLGFRDWRIPTIGEMKNLESQGKNSGYRSIVDFLAQSGFQNAKKDYYWTSTMDRRGAVYIEFFRKVSSCPPDQCSMDLIPVRGGEGATDISDTTSYDESASRKSAKKDR